MMEKIIIRKEEKNDYYDTEPMTQRAFWNKHRPGCDEHNLVHKLRSDQAYLPELSRLAVLDGKIVGWIMYSKARIVNLKPGSMKMIRGNFLTWKQ
ncbi:MAG: GNAT family N-acetyltransferase [Lachnospiraceae bacterium]